MKHRVPYTVDSAMVHIMATCSADDRKVLVRALLACAALRSLPVHSVPYVWETV